MNLERKTSMTPNFNDNAARYDLVRRVDSEVVRQNVLLDPTRPYLFFIEETAEVNQLITKLFRRNTEGYSLTEEELSHLKEEVSDVYYALSMLVQHLDMSYRDVNLHIFNQENRAKARMSGIDRVLTADCK